MAEIEVIERGEYTMEQINAVLKNAGRPPLASFQEAVARLNEINELMEREEIEGERR